MDDNDGDMHNVIRKLMHPSTQRMGDLSGSGYGNDYDGIMHDDDDDMSSGEGGEVVEGGMGVRPSIK